MVPDKQTNLEIIRQKCIEANPEPYKNLVRDNATNFATIRLADVLLAIYTKLAREENIKSERIRGMQQRNRYGALVDVLLDKYDLRKDDLNDQSEETITFIAQLLGPD